MEFVRDNEVMGLLKEQGVIPVPVDDDRVYLQMSSAGPVVRLHLAAEGSTVEPEDGAQIITVETDRLAEAIDGMIHKLHLSQLILIPVEINPIRNVDHTNLILVQI